MTTDQATNISRLLSTDKKGMIDLDGSYIAIHAIDGIVTPADYEVVNYKRRLAWQCKYKFWHEKNENCAHARMPNVSTIDTQP